MSRRALKRVWKPVHSHKDHARIRIHESDSLPHAALVRADRPVFECPRCGWANDRAPFCLWCLCQDEAATDKWRPLRRRITSPSLACALPPPPPPTRRPFSSPVPPSPLNVHVHVDDSSLPPTPTSPNHPPPVDTPAPPPPSSSLPTDNDTGGGAAHMSIPSPASDTTSFTIASSNAPVHIPASAPAVPCTPPASPLLSSQRVRYPSFASTSSPPPPTTPTKFAAYISRKTAEREARMHRIAEAANAAAVTLAPDRPTSPLAPPAPGAIALGHLLPIPGSLRISCAPAAANSGSMSSRTSLDLRSVRSREAESVYSPARSARMSAASRSSAGARRSRSVHRRGGSSQYSLAPALPSPAEHSDEEEDLDLELQLQRVPQTPSKRARLGIGKFFHRVGEAMHLPTPGRRREREKSRTRQEDVGNEAAVIGWTSPAGERGGASGGGGGGKFVGGLLLWTSNALGSVGVGRRRR